MRREFMNPANVYWKPPQYKQTFLPPISGTLGYLHNLPFPDPVSTLTFGQGNENIYGKREMVFTGLPELFAVGGILPTTAGHPRVDPNSFAAQHNRQDFTIKV